MKSLSFFEREYGVPHSSKSLHNEKWYSSLYILNTKSTIMMDQLTAAKESGRLVESNTSIKQAFHPDSFAARIADIKIDGQSTEFLKKFGSSEALNAELAKEENLQLNKRDQAFRQSISEAVPNDLDKATRKAHLREFAGLEQGPLSNPTTLFNKSELMTILNAFRALSDWQSMLELASECNNAAFLTNPLVRERLAVAHNKKRDPDPVSAIAIGEGLVAEGHHHAEVFAAAIGKGYYLKYDAASAFIQSREELAEAIKNGGSPESASIRALLETHSKRTETMKRYFPGFDTTTNVEELRTISLRESGKAYEQGFRLSYEYYPGINVAYCFLEKQRLEIADAVQKNQAPTFDALNRARATASMVHLSCQIEGGVDSLDYWCVTSMLEATCLMGSTLGEVKPSLDRVLAVAENDWEVSTSLNKLRGARDLFSIANSNDPSLKIFDHVIEQLSERLSRIETINQTSDRALREDLKEALYSEMQSYRTYATLSDSDLRELPKEDLFPLLKTIPSRELNLYLAKMSEELRSEFLRTVSLPRLNDIKLQAILDSTYSYRSVGSDFVGGDVISGNMKFGGQLWDNAMSRFDMTEFMEAMDVDITSLVDLRSLTLGERSSIDEAILRGQRTLGKIKDPELFLDVVREVVRERFKTKSLENLDGQPHDIFDATVAGLIELAGGAERKGVDGRVNTTVAFLIAVGDCRHHANVAQGFYDTWSASQLKPYFDAMYAAIEAGNRTLFSENAAKVSFLSGQELRTADLVIETQWKMEQQTTEDGKRIDIKYSPLLFAGHKVLDDTGEFHQMEDHSLNILVDRYEQSVSLRDTFYNQVYQFGEGIIPLEEIELKIVNKLVGDRVIPFLVPVIPLPSQHDTDPRTGERVEAMVRGFPTEYSGTRHKPISDETGTPRLVGRELSAFDFVTLLSPKRREEFAQLRELALSMPSAQALLAKRQLAREKSEEKMAEELATIHRGVAHHS